MPDKGKSVNLFVCQSMSLSVYGFVGQFQRLSDAQSDRASSVERGDSHSVDMTFSHHLSSVGISFGICASDCSSVFPHASQAVTHSESE